jgi:hypothetical protein
MKTQLVTFSFHIIHFFTLDRYSLQNVAARKLNDGTVVPVTQPKKLPNGEYARPIGRQRKGMEWDSIRGVWIPEGGRSSVEEG